MKTWTKAVCLALCAGLVVTGAAVGLKSQPGDKKTQPPGGKEGMDPMMAMMLEMSQPVAQHEIIKGFAGTWNADVKMWMDPTSKEPTSSKGTMKGTLLHGGRYLLGEYSGMMGETPFTGTMMWAYNRVDGRYESTWFDSWSTGIFMSKGQATADGKGVESTGTFRMPGPDGKLSEITQREKIAMIGKDKYFMEMWHATKEEGEKKVMEITYTRTAEGARPSAPAVPGVTMPPGTR